MILQRRLPEEQGKSQLAEATGEYSKGWNLLPLARKAANHEERTRNGDAGFRLRILERQEPVKTFSV